jgi:hypothetical protein
MHDSLGGAISSASSDHKLPKHLHIHECTSCIPCALPIHEKILKPRKLQIIV